MKLYHPLNTSPSHIDIPLSYNILPKEINKITIHTYCDGFYTILSVRRTRSTVPQSNNHQFLHQKMFIFKGTVKTVKLGDKVGLTASCHAKIVPGENCTGRYNFRNQNCTAVQFWLRKVYRPCEKFTGLAKSVPGSEKGPLAI